MFLHDVFMVKMSIHFRFIYIQNDLLTYNFTCEFSHGTHAYLNISCIRIPQPSAATLCLYWTPPIFTFDELAKLYVFRFVLANSGLLHAHWRAFLTFPKPIFTLVRIFLVPSEDAHSLINNILRSPSRFARSRLLSMLNVSFVVVCYANNTTQHTRETL